MIIGTILIDFLRMRKKMKKEKNNIHEAPVRRFRRKFSLANAVKFPYFIEKLIRFLENEKKMKKEKNNIHEAPLQALSTKILTC